MGEVGYDRAVRAPQDDEAWVADHIQGVTGGQPRVAMAVHDIFVASSH